MVKRYKRILAAAMAVMLTVQGMGTMGSVRAQSKMTKVRSESQTQMSSEPEAVYVNSYSDATVRTQNFDSNWKFYLGEAGEAQTPGYDDSKWRQISLPHDYSIEQEFSQSMEAESGYLPGGTGWYRKNFVVGNELSGKRVRIDFDGVYMNATVWVNGHQLGMHPYGYTPFSFDITDYVEFGSENTIAVKVDHKTPSSRWYSGSGIYRSVNLTITDQVHVDLYGTKIETPNLEAEQGGNVAVNVKTSVVNDSAEAKDVSVTHTIFEKGGDTSANIGTVTTQAQRVAAGAVSVINADLTAADPTLWDVENPQLYTVRTEVKVGDEVVDTYDSDYGFRYFAVNNTTGFSLNGEKLKLKGVCMHHDQGALGAVANRRAIERQVEILKEMGCNSIRVTHNPAAQNLIDVCNEKGILVIDEFFDGWMFHKNGNSNDYAAWFNTAIAADNEILHKASGMTWAEFDLKAAIGRGQNAPSIIMWSLGNEIQEGTAYYNGYAAKADELIRWAEETDDTRLLTIGSNAVKNGGSDHVEIGHKLTAAGGLSGTNYSNGGSYDALHYSYPNWNLYGSETASSVNSRGIYTTKASNSLNADKQLTSYDKSRVGWGALASEAWYDVITRDFVAGEYVWTGFDYIGEPTPANGTDPGPKTAWPSPKNSFFGIIDTAGFPKDSYYLYQSQWNEKVNTLHILPAWNENALMKDGNNNVEVVVYSDAAKVKLFLNDELIGEQTFTKKTTGAGYTYQTVNGQNNHQSLYMTFSVPFRAGTLRAEAYDENDQLITNTQGRSEVVTTGAAAKLSASADRTAIAADGKDLTYITVDVTDADGNIVPDAANRVTFDVKGEGVLVGVDNGSSPDHDSYQGTSRKAFSGKVLAIVQSTKNAGDITVTATADGLEKSVVTVTTTAADGGTAAEKQVSSFLMAKTYYVKAGNMPQLPAEIEARYTDGSAKKLAVVWQDITAEQIQKTGSFTVKGKVADQFTISVNVNMIDTIGGLLNYSTTTPAGVIPKLPESRPAVMQDGTIMDVAFAVNWEAKDAAAYKEIGTVEVNGTANVLGQELSVKAAVRVQKEQITVGDSISGAAYLTQDIPENMQSDTLNAIKDGSTTISDNSSGGANPTVWSNYDYSQEGHTTAELTFRYDTQQRLGEIVVYFARDGWSMRFPDAEATEIYISEDGADGSWTKVEATETIGTESNRVKPYTYKFAPVTATFVKFCLTNYSGTTGTSAKPCTGITEIALKEAKGAFVTNTTAAFEKLAVNGVELSVADIAKGSYATSAILADVEAVAADNAAVTMLPVYEDTIRIIIESEDHKTRNTFTIYLNQEETSHLPADDDSRDYPSAKCTAFADSQYLPGTANEGPARFVLDGNGNTHWHTNWQTTEAKDVNKRWVGVTLEEPAKLEALRYLPRSGNGDVTEYKVQYRETENGEWKDIAAGTWTRSGKEWKLAEFDRPVVAKQVRLIGVHTWADSGNDAHMSVSELRVRKAADKIDIAGEDFVITVPETVEVSAADAEHPVLAEVTVANGETILRYGVDYLLTYENNTSFGTASVTIKGIGVYGGTVTRQFEIVKETVVEGYKVTVDGVTTIHQYNDKVQLTAPEAPEGKKFAGWVVNGEMITANPKYEVYVSGDMTITSKFVDSDAEIAKEEARAILSNVIVTDSIDKPGKADIKFVAQLVVPEGYTIQEAGLVWSNKGKSDAAELTLENAEKQADGVKVTKIAKISSTWQYSVTIKGVPSTTMVPGRAFAKMINQTTGEVVYSEVKLANEQK